MTLDDLVDIIGLNAAIELTRRWGRRTIYVLREPKLQHPITLTIGYEASKKLSEARGGEQFVVPAELRTLRELRDRLIREEYEAATDKPASVNALAIKYGVSRKWVNSVLERGGVRRRGDGERETRQARWDF